MSKFNLSQLMNEKSKSEAAPVKNRFDIELLPIEKIIPSQMNKYTVADVEDLKASIEMMGLQQNLLVRERDAGDYEIISGHRRFKAMQELYADGNMDFAKVPCKVIKSMDDVTAELQLLFANSTSRQLTDYERTYQAKRIRELLTDLKKSGFKFTGRMREIVAGIIEMSPAQVGRMESINENLSPEFTEEFKAGKIGVTAAYELSRLSPKQQAYKMAEYQQTGVIEVKGIRQKCEQTKPQPAKKPPQPTPAPSKPAPQPSELSAPDKHAEHTHSAERHAQDEIALDDCPHCGGKAEYRQFANPKNFYSAVCTVCGCETDGFRLCRSDNTAQENKAVNAKVWNRRV